MKKDDEWLIDNSCTNHIAKSQTFFTHIDPTIKVSVKIGDGGLVESSEKALLQSKPIGAHNTSKMYSVPYMDQNLLSMSQMILNGYSLLFEGKAWAIFNPQKKTIASVKMKLLS